MGRGETVELSIIFTEVNSRVCQLLIGIPADGHAIITRISQPNLDRCSLGIAQGWVGRGAARAVAAKATKVAALMLLMMKCMVNHKGEEIKADDRSNFYSQLSPRPGGLSDGPVV